MYETSLVCRNEACCWAEESLVVSLVRLKLWADMKLNVLMWVAALLAAFLPRSADCRPVDAPISHRLLLPRPLLLHLGEEFSLRLGGGQAAPDLLSSSSSSTSSSSSEVNRALLKLTQHLLQARAEEEKEEEDAEEKGKRSDEPPISLDLTFHLLREVLEMARAEQMAQQADSNRKMMDTFGKWVKDTKSSLPVEFLSSSSPKTSRVSLMSDLQIKDIQSGTSAAFTFHFLLHTAMTDVSSMEDKDWLIH